MRHSLTAYRATGSGLVLPYFLARLAEACGKGDHMEAGLPLLEEALTFVDQHEEGWWEAEIHRLKGVFLVQQAVPDAQQAEGCLQQALAVARRQQAKSLELRAAMSLSRLWQQQGKPAEARALLAPIYGWFTEGFETVDLQEAQVLLEQLAG